MNLLGTINVMRLAAQAIARTQPDAAGQRGLLVNTASIAFEAQIGQIAYAASKAGVAGMTVTAARDLAPVRHPRHGHRTRHRRHPNDGRLQRRGAPGLGADEMIFRTPLRLFGSDGVSDSAVSDPPPITVTLRRTTEEAVEAVEAACAK